VGVGAGQAVPRADGELLMGQMSWRSPLGDNGTKILHLRAREGDRWLPYTTSPHRIPDYQIPGGSAGWATYQFLLGAGWAIHPYHEQARGTP